MTITDLIKATEGATEGPWASSGRYIGTPSHMSYIGEARDENGNWSDTAKSRKDATLIAAAPTFRAEVIRLMEEVERLREALRQLEHGLSWDWRGHPTTSLPDLKQIAQQALENQP